MWPFSCFHYKDIAEFRHQIVKYQQHNPRDRERAREIFFIKDFKCSALCSLIDSLIIPIRKCCCDEKFVDLGKELSSMGKRQTFDQDSVAPSVYPCAIVAVGLISKVVTPALCYIPSESKATGQAFRGTHTMCNRPLIKLDNRENEEVEGRQRSSPRISGLANTQMS